MHIKRSEHDSKLVFCVDEGVLKKESVKSKEIKPI
jgi:hypothetical protein